MRLIRPAEKSDQLIQLLITKGVLKGYNTDWVGVKNFFELSNFKSIYIVGDGGFSQAIQYT